MNVIEIWIDGGVRGNGTTDSIGGYGIVLKYKGTTKELRGGAREVTNNVMELMAAIQALKAVKNKTIPVIVTSDSKYVVDGITTWIYQWVSKKWKNSQGKPVENKELWMDLLKEKIRFTKVDFVHVRGHQDNEGNNRADKLANIAMDELQNDNSNIGS
jgi:ribonuclease HI